ncbi:hypothetical protein F2Q69_00019840 [Brassica cretica]|uniref:Uncharacterized protein n=1 Tax=Brassica cretica TaxID=69181 RepID=A0A8S9Q408_BRACR|nr:hypothetical protein F2Q69_00019840 [Brassica cretica]
MLGLSVKMVSAQCCWFGYEGANSALTVMVFDGAAFDSDGAAFGGDGGVCRLVESWSDETRFGSSILH